MEELRTRIEELKSQIAELKKARINGFDTMRELEIATLQAKLISFAKQLSELEGDEPTETGLDH